MTATYEIGERLFHQNNLKTLMFAALRRVIDRHPVMSISIVDEGSLNPAWVRLPEIDLEKVVHFRELEEGDVEGSCRSIIEAAHQIPFEDLGQLPLWRVVLVEHETTSSNDKTIAGTKTIDVGFFWHHGIGDGGSGVAFHLEILDALNDLAIKNDVPLSADAIVIPPKRDLLPSIEEAQPLRLSTFFLIKQIFKLIFPSKPDELLWTGPPLRAEKNITHLRTLFLPVSIVDVLLRRCRENNVTLTSLLIVVIARVLATIYPSHKRFTCKTAISLRRFTGTDERAMVNYVSTIRHYFSSAPKRSYIDCGGNFSWSAVRACRQDINAATSSAKNQGIGLLKYLDDYVGWLRKQIGVKRGDSFEVSNLGVMDGGLDDLSREAKIRRTVFSQSSNVMGPAYIFSVATVKGGDLAIGLTWQDGIVDTESVQKVLVGLVAELEGLAKCQ